MDKDEVYIKDEVCIKDVVYIKDEVCIKDQLCVLKMRYVSKMGNIQYSICLMSRRWRRQQLNFLDAETILKIKNSFTQFI